MCHKTNCSRHAVLKTVRAATFVMEGRGLWRNLLLETNKSEVRLKKGPQVAKEILPDLRKRRDLGEETNRAELKAEGISGNPTSTLLSRQSVIDITPGGKSHLTFCEPFYAGGSLHFMKRPIKYIAWYNTIG